MPSAQNTGPSQRFRPQPFGGVLDESLLDVRNTGLTVAQNVVYRPFGSIGKRTGSSGYGNAFTAMGAYPVLSGRRWYRGSPSTLKQMIAQCNDTLFVGDDATGGWTNIGSLSLGSTPAFYAQSYDPAESGVTGTPPSDILIIAYGSGQPKKYDGNVLTNLSSTITNQFTGCVSWHDHVFFWGDPNNPDDLFATDLLNPEGFTFTNQQNPPGYQIGRGDGDATVQVAVPLGATMAVFKTRSIYAMTGYGFTAGEYQFALTPWITDKGTPAPFSVAVMNNTLFWWDGSDFYRMGAADTTPTPIGLPIVKTAAMAASSSQSAIRAVAGNFLVQTVSGPISYTNVYLCAVETGLGYADTILMYDDDASAFAGKPAWSVFKGLNIGCFIPWGGPGDQQLLYCGDAVNGTVRLFGGNATADLSNATPAPAMTVNVTTGRIDCGSADQTKLLRKIWLETESNSANFNLQVVSNAGASQTSTQAIISSAVGSVLGTTAVDATVLGSAGGQNYQSTPAIVAPSLRGQNYQININESSLSSAYALVGLSLDIITEAYPQ